MTTTLELVQYYAKLLVQQFVTKAKAIATVQAYASQIIMPQVSVQTLTWVTAPASGTFVLAYGAGSTTTLNWNDSAATIQAALRSVSGLASALVTGSIAGLALTVTFEGVIAPAQILAISSSTLNVTPTIAETDLTLPLAVQTGFNLIDDAGDGGQGTAVGAQLDLIGTYVGVKRTGAGFSKNITLDDADFLTLIRMAIVTNSSGSSLATIQALLNQFFPDELLVFDYQNMQMSYLISTAVGSQDLVQLFVTEGLLPRPMAVNLTVIIYAPDIKSFFGFRTYTAPAFNATPFNSYTSYQTDWPWLTYADAVAA